MEEKLAWFGVVEMLIPSTLEDLFVARHFDPIFFKTKGLGALRAGLTSKKEGTMIREQRG